MNVLFGDSSAAEKFVVIGNDGSIKVVGDITQLLPGEIVVSKGEQPVTTNAHVAVGVVAEDGNITHFDGVINQIFAQLEEGQDPTQLGEEFATAAGVSKGSAGTLMLVIERTASEVLATTTFDTQGIVSLELSATEPLDLLAAEVNSITPNTVIKNLNDVPVASADTASTEENVLLNSRVPIAKDVDGTVESYKLVSDVAEGNLSFKDDGSYTFDPGKSFDDLGVNQSRDVIFTYTAIDNDGGVSEPKAITITVTGINDVAKVTVSTTSDDKGAVQEDGVVITGGKLDVADLDTGEAVFIEQKDIADDNYGFFSIDAAGNWSYRLNNTHVDVQALDSHSASVTRTMTVTTADGTTSAIAVSITGSDDAPVAVDDTAITAEDTVLNSVINLSANDTDLDGDTLSVVAGTFTTRAGGSIEVFADGRYTYTPAANFHGTDLVDYTLTDGRLTDIGTLTLTVSPENDAPVAVDDTAITAEDTVLNSVINLSANDTDLDGDTLSVVAGTFTTRAGGSIEVFADGSYTYTPVANFHGADSVDYTLTDGRLTDTGTLTLTVSPENDAPVFMEISGYSFKYDEGIDAKEVIGTVSATDVDNNALTYFISQNICNSNKEALYAIDQFSGAISLTEVGRFAYTNDYEDLDSKNSRDITVGVSDVNAGQQGNITEVNVKLSERNVNDSKTIIEGDKPLIFKYAEGTDAGVALGRVSATDTDGDSIVYIITSSVAEIDHGQPLFAIDSHTGVISLTKAGYGAYTNDYESEGNIHTFNVKAIGYSGSKYITQDSVEVILEELDIPEITNDLRGNTSDSGVLHNDIINDQGGDDTILGSLGNDILTGGEARGLFVWSEEDLDGCKDVITDFHVGEDRIDQDELFGNSSKSEAELELLLSNIRVIDSSEGGKSNKLTEDLHDGTNKQQTILIENVADQLNAINLTSGLSMVDALFDNIIRHE